MSTVDETTGVPGGRVTESRVGLAAFSGLYGAALGRIRRSPSVRASLFRWSALGLVTTVGFAVGVAQLVDRRAVILSAIGAVAWWLVVEAVLVGAVVLLETPDGRPVDRYGVPNGLSAIRAWWVMPLMLCASLSLPGRLSLILWLTIGGPVGFLDFVDGWIARRFGPVTRLGQAIDPAGDACYFSAAAVGNVLVGIIPLWLAVFMVLRYLGPLFGTPIVLLTRRRPQLVYTEWGRRNTMLFGVFLVVEAFVRVGGGPVDLVAIVVGIPVLVPTTFLHFALLSKRMHDAPTVRPSRRELREEQEAAAGQSPHGGGALGSG